ncbi:hypothetical protein LTR56_023839 [Elasticomyces elasticus]|nr:hypothetical protein LTR56_023839 [Elasticomyces elasticus]KAK3624426.1 hypothetical protein LTR22_023959 [Elasticomyces elasticus]KAK4906404.1 hypothetical protein LTR49_024426 [Elasticomyces elasticus]KAK5747337.1 hypothetical protein LTS12_022392 [Elasticomyces elasticus]
MSPPTFQGVPQAVDDRSLNEAVDSWPAMEQHSCMDLEDLSNIVPSWEGWDTGLQSFGVVPGTHIVGAKSSPASASTVPISSRPQVGDEKVVRQLCGLTGDMDPYLVRHYRFDEANTMLFKKLAIYSVSVGTLPVQFVQPEEQDVGDLAPDRTELDGLITLKVGENLIDLFFRFLPPALPVFLSNQRPSASKDPVHLLAAIYLVAQPFSRYDEYLCIQTVYDSPPIGRLWDTVIAALHGGTSKPSISLLQAALILLSSPPKDNLVPEDQERYMISGLAAAMAQSLGLWHDAREWPIAADEKRLRRRLSWCLRYQDQWIAFVAGRSPHIRDADWLVQELSENDFCAVEITQGIARSAIAMTKLAVIMGSVYDTLFTLKSAQSLSTDFRGTLRAAQPIMETLNLCYSGEISAANDGHDLEVDQAGHLLLAFHSVRTLLFRAILRPFHNLVINENDTAESEACQYVRAAARASLVSFIDFTATLTAARIRAFWPFWSTGSWALMCNLSLLLTLTATSEADKEECRLELKRARRSLTLHSSSLPLLNFACLRIDAVFWKGTNDLFGVEIT